MTTVRALIVDDEEPARELLRSFLARWPTVAVVGEAGDGSTAVDMIRLHRPDLVFLDVQMPEMSGFDVVASLAPDEVPVIVFVTAYDQHALRAFDVSACDYLLKPFDAERLAGAMARVFGRLERPTPELGAALRTLLAQVLPTRRSDVVVKADGRHLFLQADEIAWIEAVGKEARLHLATSVLTIREPMNSLEQRLDSARFIRVHRSAIVNRSHVREVQPWFKGDYVVILRSGARVVTGRTYRPSVQRMIEVAREG